MRSAVAPMPERKCVRTNVIRVCDVVPGGISLGHRQCSCGDVGRDDVGRGKLQAQRHRQAAGSRADIDDQARVLDELGDRLFDDEFGFGARDEDVWRHLEIETPELSDAHDHRHRLPGCPPRHERFERGLERWRRCLAAAREQRRPIPAQRMTREHGGIDRRVGRLQPRPHERVAGGGDSLVQWCAHQWVRFSAVKCVAAASINAAMSPSSAVESWCIV